MKNFDARAYSVSDFLEWRESSLLDLSPKFQRRGVWTRAAKSFLIDTLLRGKPMPKVLLTQDLVEKKNVRTVVDGQQRIRTILEFVGDGFTVLKAHNPTHSGKKFSQLDQEVQDAILQYEIGVDLLYSTSLADMLDIFARINTYSVTLNRQEKLNAKYLGVFKTSSYELGHRYVGYLLDADVLSEKIVSRMGEAELASDLLVALVDGIQSIKNIEKYYKRYEQYDLIPEEITWGRQLFDDTMNFIGAIYEPSLIKQTNWSRSHWFYTLFTCVAYCLHPKHEIMQLTVGTKRPTVNDKTVVQWRDTLDQLSALYDQYTTDDNVDIPAKIARFIGSVK